MCDLPVYICTILSYVGKCSCSWHGTTAAWQCRRYCCRLLRNCKSPVPIRSSGGANLVDRYPRFFHCLLMGQNPVGSVIVTRAVARHQLGCGFGFHLRAGGPVFVSPPWFRCVGLVGPLILLAVATASIPRRVVLIAGKPRSGLFMPLALALDPHDVAVVHQPIHRCHGHRSASQDIAPRPKRLVCSHQQGFTLVALPDQFKQH